MHYRREIIKETITSLFLRQTVDENHIFYYEQSQRLIWVEFLLLNIFLSLSPILSFAASFSLARLSPQFRAFWISDLFPRSNFNFLPAVRCRPSPWLGRGKTQRMRQRRPTAATTHLVFPWDPSSSGLTSSGTLLESTKQENVKHT